MPRVLPILLVALAAALAPVAAASPTQALAVITVGYPTGLQVTGTDIYCGISRGTTTSVKGKRTSFGVSCFHAPNGIPTGYAVFAADSGVDINRARTAKIVVSRTEPQLPGAATSPGGGSPVVVDFAPGDVALIRGTHLALLGSPSPSGGNAVAILALDAQRNPIVGSFGVGISNHAVTIVKVTGLGTTKVVYQHLVH